MKKKKYSIILLAVIVVIIISGFAVNYLNRTIDSKETSQNSKDNLELDKDSGIDSDLDSEASQDKIQNDNMILDESESMDEVFDAGHTFKKE